MSWSAKPTTTAPTAEVARSCSRSSIVAIEQEHADDGHVLDDGREAIRGPVVAPGVDQQRDDQVDERQDEDEPGQRRDERPVAQALTEGDFEAQERQQQPGAEGQPPAHEAAADGGQQRQRDDERRRAGEDQGRDIHAGSTPT